MWLLMSPSEKDSTLLLKVKNRVRMPFILGNYFRGAKVRKQDQKRKRYFSARRKKQSPQVPFSARAPVGRQCRC